MEIQIGSTIMNGSSALRVDKRVERDPIWKGPGWSGVNIPLEAFGGNPGTRGSVPDYLLSSWRHVPFDWTPCPGGAVEERYVWSRGCRYLQREVRKIVKPTFPGKVCDQSTTHEAHLWQELHIPTGNPLVEHSQWWQCDGIPLVDAEVDEFDLVQRQDFKIEGDW